MEWIKAILPLAGVGLGWFLSECGKMLADKRQDNRKLRKLLFFLLELRFQFARELSIELNLDRNIDTLKNTMIDNLKLDKSDPRINLIFDLVRPIVSKVLADSRKNDNNYDYLAENIDKVLIDLAEVFPILAYELNSQHKVKERLSQFNSSYENFQPLADEGPFLDLKQFFNSKMTKELLSGIDESIEQVAKQTNNKILNASREKISLMKFDINKVEVDTLFKDVLNKLLVISKR